MHASAAFADVPEEQQCATPTRRRCCGQYELGERRAVERVIDAIARSRTGPAGDAVLAGRRRHDRAARAAGDQDRVAGPGEPPLLGRAALAGKPMLVSTGAADDWRGRRLRRLAPRLARAMFALLHCVSAIPTPTDDANLGWIDELAARSTCRSATRDHTTEAARRRARRRGGGVHRREAPHLRPRRTRPGPRRQRRSAAVRAVRAGDPPGRADARRAAEARAAVRAGRAHGQPAEPRRSVATSTPATCSPCDDLTVQRPGTGIPAAAIAHDDRQAHVA